MRPRPRSQSARLDLQFTEVRAPIDGRAGRALVTAGNLAQADSTLLTTLVSLDPVHVYFEADEQTFLRYARTARSGDRSRTRASPVRVGLANETGFPHAGTVDFVDNQVDPRTGTIRARAVLPNADRALHARPVRARAAAKAAPQSKAHADRRQGRADRPGPQVRLRARARTTSRVRKDIELGRKVDGLRVVDHGPRPPRTA